MDEALRAYATGREDAFAGRRDVARAAHPHTGPDYRMGFLDARVEVFRMLAQAREILEEND